MRLTPLALLAMGGDRAVNFMSNGCRSAVMPRSIGAFASSHASSPAGCATPRALRRARSRSPLKGTARICSMRNASARERSSPFRRGADIGDRRIGGLLRRGPTPAALNRRNDLGGLVITRFVCLNLLSGRPCPVSFGGYLSWPNCHSLAHGLSQGERHIFALLRPCGRVQSTTLRENAQIVARFEFDATVLVR
jgi:hypothetical protein